MKRRWLTLRRAILLSSLSICLAYVVYRVAWQASSPIKNPTVGDGVAALTDAENTQEANSDVVEVEHPKQILHLLSGMKKERELIRSCVATVKRKRDRFFGEDEPQNIVYSINYNQGKMRLDRFQGDRVTRYIRTPQYAISGVFANGKVVGGALTKTKPEEFHTHSVGYFNIKCIGLLTAFEMQHHRMFGKNYSQVVELLKTHGVHQVQETGNGIYLITTSYQKSGVEKLTWIDTNRGYSPVRLEVRAGSSSSGKQTILHKCESQWEQFENVWLPISFSDVGHDGDTIEMSFAWSHVNDALPQEIFSIDDFGISSYAILVDSRVQPPVIEKIFN